MSREIRVIYEDEDYAVVEKEAGVLTIPDRYKPELFNLYTALNEKYGKIFIVHRLDKDTSGVIVFAKNAEAHRDLSIKFEKGEARKTYLAVIKGIPEKESGTIDLPLAPLKNYKNIMAVNYKIGKKSVTTYKILQKYKGYSLAEVKLLTGRMHQIRAHFRAIGNPLALDTLYTDKHKQSITSGEILNTPDNRELISRLTLHAAQIQFESIKNIKLKFGAPLPNDMSLLIQTLQKSA